MASSLPPPFLTYLEEELAIPRESIQLVLRCQSVTLSSFPMLLWQYGLISLAQLEEILDWLDNLPAPVLSV
ncbi:DUF2949 domain-containing protein [Spirulina subsalsa]|uniref:DUF2949 domain-containing protein n=1 Tax=Spirulina subsalsa TaxID=54311 RepID=UPI0003153960|nr:DUF2949 domain-containing protein [Spirulina subsalsa]